jgi:methyl-accepting chemotaxis protein
MGAITALNETGAEETENGITRMDAINMMFSEDYHRYKADIMRPIDKFFASVEARTQSRIEAARAATHRAALMGWIAAGVLVGLVALQLALLRWRLLGPLGRLRNAMQALASDRGEIEVPATDHADEIGDMARATDVFKTNKAEAERLRAEQDEMAARTAAERRQTRENLADQLSRTVGSVVGRITETVNRINESIAGIASAVQQQEGTTGEIARSIEEVSDASSTVAERVRGLREVAENTGSVAEDVRSRAGTFSSHARTLRKEVDGFMAGVREGTGGNG